MDKAYVSTVFIGLSCAAVSSVYASMLCAVFIFSVVTAVSASASVYEGTG